MATALDLPRPVARPPPRRYRRWIAIVVASLLIHAAALDTLPRWTVEPTDDAADIEPLHATLMPPIPPPDATPPPQPRPVAPPAPRPRVVRREAPPAIATTFVPESTEPPQEVAATDSAAPPRIAPTPPPAAPVETPPAAVPAPPPVATTPPQSARLDYQVVSQNAKEANPIYGRGTITWLIADGRYSTDLSAAAELFVFKFDVLASHSDGSVGPGGLAPDRYTESPRKRATVATNFNRDARQSITFSASTATVPLAPGAQDRLSVLFQIGALLLADPLKAAPGAAIDIPVAGVRGDVETWRFDVRGSEAIETGLGSLATTHLQRAPRPGTNDRTIDLWIAQSDGGYPARVLYTEPSGNTVTMTLDRIAALR